MIDEDKKAWLGSILRRIHGISNKEYQIRVWINGMGPECDDFDETSEYILGDVRDILKDYCLFGITEDQYHLLKKFHEDYEAFNDQDLSYDDPERFIDTPEWAKIMEMAKKVLKAFNYRRSSASYKPVKNRDQINEHDWAILDKIFNDPGKIVYPLRNECLKIYPESGRGAFFKKDGSFRGFIERNITQKADLLHSIRKKFTCGYRKLFPFFVSKYFRTSGKGRDRNSEQDQQFLIELCSDLDSKKTMVDVSFGMQTIASINSNKEQEALEIEIFPFGSDSQKTILPFLDFLSALEKAKRLAVKYSQKR